MTREEKRQIIDIVHKTIYSFFDVCDDNEEIPMSDKDKLLLKVNKAICNNIKALEEEPKTGKWIKIPKAVMGEGFMWYCNRCEYQVYQDSSKSYPSENYCPNCGTRMKEESI